MIKQHKYDIIVFLALFAAGVSLYLTISHYLGFRVPCDITHGCQTVLTSKYSEIFGVPLSLLGIIYFVGVIGFALLANHYSLWRKLLTILLGLGTVSAIYFLSIQFFVLHTVCQYCLAVDLTSIILFLWDLNIEHTIEKSLKVI